MLKERAEENKTVVKTGRTHLMDAMPVTLGQEIGGWAAQITNGPGGYGGVVADGEWAAEIRRLATERNATISEHLAPIVARAPSGRLSGTDEVAAAVVFLAGDAASGINGATLTVDGGWSAV